RDYFDQGNYKDDRLALAIELHPKYVAAYDRFRDADVALGREVDAIEDQLQTAELAALEKSEGKQLHWHHKRMLIAAKAAVPFAGGVKTPFEIKDLAAYEKAVTAVDTAMRELLEFYAKHKEEIDKGTMSYWTIENPMKDFVKDCKDMMRRKRDKQA